MNTTDAPAKPASGTWKAVLLLVVVFFLGAATSIGGGLLFLRSQIRKAATAPSNNQGPLDRLSARIESHLGDHLKLSPSERGTLHEELAVTTRRAKELRLRLADDIRALADETITRIGSHLPADKQAKLRQEVDERLAPWGLQPKAGGEVSSKTN